jgi:dihydroneopterin aldolase
MTTENAETEFERRTRALLEASAEELSGHVRSRLTQARHAALAVRRPGSAGCPRAPPPRWCCWR